MAGRNSNSEIEVTDYPEQDCLWFIRFISFGIFQFKIVKLDLVVTMQFCLVIAVAQTYLFLKKSDIQYFVTYLFSSSGILGCASILTVNTYQADYLEVTEIWALKDQNHLVNRTIQKEAKWLTRLALFNILLGVVGGAALMAPTDDDEDIFIVYVFVEDFVIPAWKIPLSIIFGLSCSFLSFVVISALYQIIYGLFHFKSQIAILMGYVESIDDLQEEYKEETQREIKARLVFTVDRHVRLIKSANASMNHMWVLTILYVSVGALCLISLIFFIFMFQEMGIMTLVRIIPLNLSSLVIATTFVMYGQNFEDSTSIIFDTFSSLKWYSWNEENRRLYLIIMTRISDEIRVKLTETVAINHQLGIQILKTVYSIVSVLMQVRKTG